MAENPIDATYRRLLDAKKMLDAFMTENQEFMTTLAELTDAYNDAVSAHVQVLKTERQSGPLHKMTIPRKFVCPDPQAAKDLLGERFAEFFAVEYRPKTDIIRNAISSNTAPGLEMVVTEVEETPRHTGPKPVSLKELSWSR
jgi:hypothetical protein